MVVDPSIVKQYDIRFQEKRMIRIVGGKNDGLFLLCSDFFKHGQDEALIL